MKRTLHLLGLFAATLVVFTSSIAAAAGVEVRTLSGRPDMVTGGDALVETNASPEKLSATLNGADVTKSFHPGKMKGTLVAHIDGLKTGKNTLEIKSAKGSAKLELTNYPLTGPVFSGPHQKPFVCQTEAAGLGAPTDEDCSVKTVVTYAYKSSTPPPPAGDEVAARQPPELCRQDSKRTIRLRRSPPTWRPRLRSKARQSTTSYGANAAPSIARSMKS